MRTHKVAKIALIGLAPLACVAVFAFAENVWAFECTCATDEQLPGMAQNRDSNIEWQSSVFLHKPETPANKSQRCYLQTIKNITDTHEPQSLVVVDWHKAGVLSKKRIDPGFGLCATVPDPDGLASESTSGLIVYALTPEHRTRYHDTIAAPWTPRGGFGDSSRVPRDGIVFLVPPLISNSTSVPQHAAIQSNGYTSTVGLQNPDGKLIDGIQFRSYMNQNGELSYAIESVGELIREIVIALPMSEAQVAFAKAGRAHGVELREPGLLEVRLPQNGRINFNLGPTGDQFVTIMFVTVQARNADHQPIFTIYTPVMIPIKFVRPSAELNERLWKQ